MYNVDAKKANRVALRGAPGRKTHLERFTKENGDDFQISNYKLIESVLQGEV
ncbi:MAG TPA: hypothetical protein VMW72_05185 [Sedimentisphaerales bacterium]|nr:hypothetical protein [Sedimentisphaerales bacterium]